MINSIRGADRALQSKVVACLRRLPKFPDSTTCVRNQ